MSTTFWAAMNVLADLAITDPIGCLRWIDQARTSTMHTTAWNALDILESWCVELLHS